MRESEALPETEALHGAKAFFVIGGPATNPQALARLLDRHPRIACTNDLYLLDPGPDKNGLIWCKFNPERKLDDEHGFSPELRAKVWQCFLDLKDMPVLEDMAKTIHRPYQLLWAYRRAMDLVIDDIARRRQARAVGDCWEWHLWHLDILLEAYPGATLFYVTRNPHEVWARLATQSVDLANSGLSRLIEADNRLHGYKVPVTIVPHDAIEHYPDVVMRNCLQRLGLDDEPLVGADPWPDRWTAEIGTEPMELPAGTFDQISRHTAEYCQRYHYPTSMTLPDRSTPVERAASDVYMDWLRGKPMASLKPIGDDTMVAEDRLRHEAVCAHDGYAHLEMAIAMLGKSSLDVPEQLLADTCLDHYRRGYRTGLAHERAFTNIRINDLISANRLYIESHDGRLTFMAKPEGDIRIEAT